MAEITFWTYLADENNAHESVNSLRRLMQIFYNRQDYEVFVIKPASLKSAEIYSFEQEFTQNVAIIDCDEVTRESAQDVMLEYANGLGFLEINSDLTFDEHTFEKLLYDANICDEDNFKYLRDKYTYILMGNGDKSFRYEKGYEYKCLTDYKDAAGSIDVRYLDVGVETLKFIQGNATELAGIGDSSLEYLSCLHALEHFGLGRYGDPIDFNGWKKALYQYKRVLKKNGLLFLSVPVGRIEKVMFNAHRIFNPMTIVNELYPDMRLLEFTCIHDGKNTTMDFSSNNRFERIQAFLDEYTDNKMGNYDCGIFIFERC